METPDTRSAAHPLDLGGEAGDDAREVRRQADLLAQLLREAIAYLDGEAAAAGVDAAKAAEGLRPYEALSADEAEFLARAFACHALLENMAEEVTGRRRQAEGRSAGASRAVTLRGAVEGLAKAGRSEREIAEALARLRVAPVFTAHPTEVRRRALVDREGEITRLMALRRHRLPPALEAEAREALFREVALLWRTRLNRPEKIAVADEIRNVLSVVRQSVLPAVAALYADWQGLLTDAETPPVLSLGSWLGGDRDGHPGVDAAALRTALEAQARLICDFYAGELRALWRDLAISSGFAEVSAEIRELGAAMPDPSPHRRDEPYRLALEAIFDRLSAVSQKLTGQPVAFALTPSQAQPYDDPEAFIADLRAVAQSSEAHGGERMVGPRLKRLILAVQAFGFHLLTIDLRQNADVHARVVAELLARAGAVADYEALDEDARVEVLLAELAHERPLRSPYLDYSAETAKELAILDAAARALDLYGPKALGAYVISKAAAVSDILALLVLMKQAGLARGWPRPETRMRLSPLFETITDLERAPDILWEWLDLPLTRAIIGQAGYQEVMLGYSDSNKDGGYIASRLHVAQAASALSSACLEHGVALQIFHGRGGSIGRGGGPAAASVMAQPFEVIPSRMRWTEQGEMISRRYGDEESARRRMDELVGAVLAAGARQQIAPSEAHADRLARLRKGAFGAYRELVYENAAFEDFFWSATPIGEIAELNIGSRPASRTKSRKIEDLRAIPWVFSWTQSRFMLPGWFGFAGGVKRAGLTRSELAEMAHFGRIFPALLADMELALAQADMELAGAYAELSPDRDAARAIMDVIRADYEQACELAVSIRRGTRLLDDRPALAEWVQVAADSIAPLNRLQLELLARRRRGDDDPRLKRAVEFTVAGISAGLRGTG